MFCFKCNLRKLVTLPSPYVPAVYLSTSVCFWGLGGWGGGGGQQATQYMC